MRRLLLSLLSLAVLSCGPTPVAEDDGGAGGGASATGGGDGATGGGTSATGGGGSSATGGGGSAATGGGLGGGGGSSVQVTFCDVQPVLQQRCLSCHGPTPNPGAPVLVTRAELLSGSPLGGTYLDRAIVRMQSTPVSAAMPPGVGGTAAEIDLFTRWRAAGAPDCAAPTGGGGGSAAGGGGGGGVATGGGGGVPAGGGSGGGGVAATPTCASNLTWSFGNNTAGMNPGEACVACHTSMRRGPVDGFMGTVYPAATEKKLCMVSSVPSGLTVEILDLGGVVRQSFSINGLSDGNFRGGAVGSPSPYTARVKVNGAVVSEMTTPQTNGDCNVCHTPTGEQGAPGRIHW